MTIQTVVTIIVAAVVAEPVCATGGGNGTPTAVPKDGAPHANDVVLENTRIAVALRYEGIYRYSHGPFPGDLKPVLHTFNNSSASYDQDTSDVLPEGRDRGEVWAMQEFMRSPWQI